MNKNKIKITSVENGKSVPACNKKNKKTDIIKRHFQAIFHSMPYYLKKKKNKTFPFSK